MTTAIYAILVTLALFGALGFVYRLFRLCAKYRNELIARVRQYRELERDRNELRKTVANLADENYTALLERFESAMIITGDGIDWDMLALVAIAKDFVKR